MSTETLSRNIQAKKITKSGSLKAPATKKAANKSKSRHSEASGTKASTLGSSKPKEWLGMTRKELDTIYKQATPGKIPQGDTRGTAILAGGPLPRLFAQVAKTLAWQGKVFDLFSPEFNSGVVVNKVSPLGVNLIVAKTYRGESWLDGKDTIIIDYSSTSLFASAIRDEIREVEPGIYLGKVWWGKTRILDFALETHEVIEQ